MTEQEWLECADPQPMLDFLRGKVSDRKLRLFGLAVGRHIANPGPGTVVAWDATEQFSDNQMDWRAMQRVWWSVGGIQPLLTQLTDPRRAAEAVSLAIEGWQIDEQVTHGTARHQLQLCCDLLHDVFGNPFRPVAVDPVWLTPTVISLATAIYDDRAFDHLPILADVLEDAGCTNADILQHCRQPGEHVRGCWVVDLVLGKK
jgi:hypothetical protein